MPPRGTAPNRAAFVVSIVVLLVAVVLVARATWFPRWEYGQFYLFVWNDRAAAGWYDGAAGTSVERTVEDTLRPQRRAVRAVAEALECPGLVWGADEARPWVVEVMTRCLGSEGWELVSATETLHDGQLSPEVLVGRTYFFKRRR